MVCLSVSALRPLIWSLWTFCFVFSIWVLGTCRFRETFLRRESARNFVILFVGRYLRFVVIVWFSVGTLLSTFSVWDFVFVVFEGLFSRMLQAEERFSGFPPSGSFRLLASARFVAAFFATLSGPVPSSQLLSFSCSPTTLAYFFSERPSQHVGNRLYMKDYIEGRNLNPGNCREGQLTEIG